MCVCVSFVTPVASEQSRCVEKQSISININVAQVSNVNINTKKAFSPLPVLGAVSRSLRQRWWLTFWRRRRRWGDSFLQLELSPSGNTRGQKYPISRHTRFKHTHTITKHCTCCNIGCCVQLHTATPKSNVEGQFKF